MIDQERDRDQASDRLTLERTRRGFRLADAQLGIHAEAPEISEAYKRFCEARDQVVGAYQEAGAALRPAFDASGPRVRRRVLASGLLLCGLGLLFVVHAAVDRLGAAVVRLESLASPSGVSRAVSLFVAGLADATENMSEEREAQLRADTRRIVQRLLPLISEGRPLVDAMTGRATPAGAPALDDPRWSMQAEWPADARLPTERIDSPEGAPEVP